MESKFERKTREIVGNALGYISVQLESFAAWMEGTIPEERRTESRVAEQSSEYGPLPFWPASKATEVTTRHKQQMKGYFARRRAEAEAAKDRAPVSDERIKITSHFAFSAAAEPLTEQDYAEILEYLPTIEAVSDEI